MKSVQNSKKKIHAKKYDMRDENLPNDKYNVYPNGAHTIAHSIVKRTIRRRLVQLDHMKEERITSQSSNFLDTKQRQTGQGGKTLGIHVQIPLDFAVERFRLNNL